jgi:hypothetical protein
MAFQSRDDRTHRGGGRANGGMCNIVLFKDNKHIKDKKKDWPQKLPTEATGRPRIAYTEQGLNTLLHTTLRALHFSLP